MTEQELYARLQNAPLDEFSLVELQALQAQLPGSDRLRKALRRRIAVEELLYARLRTLNITPESIRRNADSAPRGSRRLAASVVCLTLLAIGTAAGFFWHSLSRVTPRQDVAAVPARTEKAPSEPEPSAPIKERVPTEDEADSHDSTPPQETPPGETTLREGTPPVEDEPPAAVENWPELARTVEPRPFLHTLFDDNRRGLSQRELLRWLVPVEGEKHRLFEATRSDIPVAGFEGLLRLRAPWPADAILKLAPFEHSGMAILFWKGATGTALHYYEHPRPQWLAYQVTREGSTPHPKSRVLLASDNDHYRRTLPGVVEIRHQSGKLVLSRGDTLLLEAPFPERPDEVYFSHRAWLSDLVMYRGEAFPLPESAEPAAPRVAPEPAARDWRLALPSGSTWETTSEGGVRLAVPAKGEPAQAMLTLDGPGLCEVIARIEATTGGAGIFVADASGRPLQALTLMRDERSGRLMYQFQRPDAGWFQTNVDPLQQPVPFAGPGQWVRLIAGCGTLKAWVSPDGRQWSRILEPMRGLRGPIAHVGLFAARSESENSITLSALDVRSAPSWIADKAHALRSSIPREFSTGDPSPAEWITRVWEHQPPQVAGRIWRQACIAEALSNDIPATLANRLLLSLAGDVVDADSPALEEQLQRLDRLAEWYDAWDPEPCHRFLALYERLTNQLARTGRDGDLQRIRQAYRNVPLWTHAQFAVLPESLVRRELLSAVAGDRWPELDSLCRELRFYSQTAIPDQPWPEHRRRWQPLLEACSQLAAQSLGEEQSDAPREAAGSRRRPPVQVEISPQGRNLLAELEASLGHGLLHEASQIVLSAEPQQLRTLLPSADDPHLAQNWGLSLEELLKTHPDWQQNLFNETAGPGRLRVEQAIGSGTPAAVELAALQFAGLPAVAAAHLWLGDRALASGDFVRATDEYARAAAQGDEEVRSQLAPRRKLAAAYLGRTVDIPLPPTVPFGGQEIPRAQFEALLTELRQGAQQSGKAIAAHPPAAAPIPPVAWKGRRSGFWMPSASGSNVPFVTQPADRIARQIGTASRGDFLYIASRAHLTCLNTSTGKVLWSRASPVPGGVADWPLFRPVLILQEDRLWIRRPFEQGFSLECLDANTGRELWTTGRDLSLCSEPVALQGVFFVLVTDLAGPDGAAHLSLATLDPRSGEWLSQVPVAQLEREGGRPVVCQATVSETRLVFAVSGTVMACDFRGGLVWARHQNFLGPGSVPEGYQQESSPLLHAGGRIFVAQPGCFDLECLDVETGRVRWSVPVPEFRRLLGMRGDHLYVESADGVTAYALTTGERAWSYDCDRLLDAFALLPDGQLVLSRRDPSANHHAIPSLVWLEGKTGIETKAMPLTGLEEPLPALGPFVVQGRRLWTFFGRQPSDQNRELVELRPSDEPALASAPPAPAITAWNDLAEESVVAIAQRVIPGWSISGGRQDARSGWRNEYQGRQNVLAVPVGEGFPMSISREIAIPADRPLRLACELANEPAQDWRLTVSAGGELLYSEPDEAPPTVPGTWNVRNVDLSRFAGQQVRVTITVRTKGPAAWTYIRRLEFE